MKSYWLTLLVRASWCRARRVVGRQHSLKCRKRDKPTFLDSYETPAPKPTLPVRYPASVARHNRRVTHESHGYNAPSTVWRRAMHIWVNEYSTLCTKNSINTQYYSCRNRVYGCRKVLSPWSASLKQHTKPPRVTISD